MKILKRAGLPVLSMVLTCLFPCVFLFSLNADEAKIAHIFPFFFVFLATAALIFAFASLLFRNMGRSAVVTNLCMLVVINFTMVCNGIKHIIPGFRNKILLGLVALLMVGLCILLKRKKPNLTALCGIFSLTFGVLILVNLFTAIPTLISQATFRLPEGGPGRELVSQEFQGEKRNVYYFLFDEYGGSENLMHYMDFDNEEFLTSLEDRGFSVSRTSKNTESPWTVTLIPNIMNMSYVTSDKEPINNRLRWLEEPALYQLFDHNGYEINLINQDDFLGDKGCNVLSSGQREETISDYIYENSIFVQIPWLKWQIEKYVLGRQPNSALRSMENIRDTMESCPERVGSKPTLTMGYIISPHAPFVCDRNGDPLPEEVYTQWTTMDYYYEKLLYTNDMILTTVDSILAADPQAVILLQADHGSRQPGHLVDQFGGPWFDGAVENPMMASVLNCVYVPGGSPEIEGDTCINAARKTFNAAFGLDMELLPVPEMYDIPPEYMPQAPKPTEEAPAETPQETPQEKPKPQEAPGKDGPKKDGAPKKNDKTPEEKGGRSL